MHEDFLTSDIRKGDFQSSGEVSFTKRPNAIPSLIPSFNKMFFLSPLMHLVKFKFSSK